MSEIKYVGGDALQKNIEKTKEYVDNHGGHKVINSSGTQMTSRAGMQFSNMSVSDDSTNNKTVIRQTQVVATKAEWDAMTPDPNVTYYLPWMEIPAIFRNGEYYGTNNQINDNQVSTNTTWSSNKIDSKINAKVNKSDIANNVTTTAEGKVLDARQGKALKDDIDDLQKYILNINRRTRKNITSDITSDHGARLVQAVSEQNLAKYGYAIGDYFIGASGYQYNLGDMDCNYGGYNNQAVVNTHHIGIVVDTKENTPWLSTGTVTNYSSSTLHAYLTNTALPKIKSDFKTLFGGSTGAEHLLPRTELDNAIGGWGTTWTGLANCLICALTEVQVYGSRVFGIDGNQTGTGNKHLEIFRKFRYNEVIGNMWFWLKSLASVSVACAASREGASNYAGVSSSDRAVGLILFH